MSVHRCVSKDKCLLRQTRGRNYRRQKGERLETRTASQHHDQGPLSWSCELQIMSTALTSTARCIPCCGWLKGPSTAAGAKSKQSAVPLTSNGLTSNSSDHNLHQSMELLLLLVSEYYNYTVKIFLK